MKNSRIMHIDCADIIGHRVAQHPDAAAKLAHAVSAHLTADRRLVLNLCGVPSFSLVFIRTFWSRLMQHASAADIREQLHIRSASHTLRESFEQGLERLARQQSCPRLHPPLTATA